MELFRLSGTRREDEGAAKAANCRFKDVLILSGRPL